MKKTAVRNCIKFSTLVAVSVWCGGLCLSAQSLSALSDGIKAAQSQGSVSELLALSKEADKLWPDKLDAYCYTQRKLDSAWAQLAKTNQAAREQMVQQNKIKLARARPEDPELAIAYFRAKRGTILGEINFDLSAENPNLETARSIAELIGEVRSVMVPGKPPEPVMNISPPSNRGHQPMVSGMDPNDIKNPEDRADYLKALAEKRKRNATSALQGNTLPPLNKTLTPAMQRYCGELFAKHPEIRQEAGDLAKRAHFSEDEQSRLVK